MNFGKSTENYYDTLELSSNCSPKEIKASFIKLSKKYHPDKNKDCAEAHKNFVKINEAYEVLSKDRKRYDEFLQSRAFTPRADFQQRRPGTGAETESAYEQWMRYGSPERKYSEFYQYYNRQGTYYQFKTPIKNIDPRQKYKVLAGVCLLIAFGVIGHLFAIQKISKYRQDQARKRSEIYSIMYSHGQKLAAEHGTATFRKLQSGEIKHMSVKEATAEYERRHGLKNDKE